MKSAFPSTFAEIMTILTKVLSEEVLSYCDRKFKTDPDNFKCSTTYCLVVFLKNSCREKAFSTSKDPQSFVAIYSTYNSMKDIDFRCKLDIYLNVDITLDKASID